MSKNPFNHYLKHESTIVRSGLELLDAYSSDLKDKKSVRPDSLRMAIFAFQVLLEGPHLPKIEIFDHVIQKLMRLRIVIHDYDKKAASNEQVVTQLSLFVADVNDLLKYQDKQKRPGSEERLGLESLRRSQFIIDQLREERGLIGA